MKLGRTQINPILALCHNEKRIMLVAQHRHFAFMLRQGNLVVERGDENAF